MFRKPVLCVSMLTPTATQAQAAVFQIDDRAAAVPGAEFTPTPAIVSAPEMAVRPLPTGIL